MSNASPVPLICQPLAPAINFLVNAPSLNHQQVNGLVSDFPSISDSAGTSLFALNARDATSDNVDATAGLAFLADAAAGMELEAVPELPPPPPAVRAAMESTVAFDEEDIALLEKNAPKQKKKKGKHPTGDYLERGQNTMWSSPQSVDEHFPPFAPKTVYGQRRVPQVLLDQHVEVQDKIRALLYWRKLSPPHQKELSKQYSVLQAEMSKLSKELERLATKDYEEHEQNYAKMKKIFPNEDVSEIAKQTRQRRRKAVPVAGEEGEEPARVRCIRSICCFFNDSLSNIICIVYSGL